MTNGGSRWRKVDFHLHTPGVDSFAGLPGMTYDGVEDQRQFAQAYTARLHETGVEIAAITDYNGVRLPWYDLIKDEASAYGIIVLPGAELNLSEGKQGIHILTVFAEGTSPTAINDYLKALDRDPSRPLWTGREHRDIELQKPLAEALRQLQDRFGCLIIPAHVDGKKGIVEAMGANLAARLIAETDLDALDHAGGALHKLRSTGVVHHWDHLAQVEFSDPRCIADISGKQLPGGTPRGTWLKLSATTLDAMHLAFHDPQTRVRTTEPAQPRNGRLISVAIDGTGFLADTKVTFDSNLNTLIGGRGTGKSALLESIRYGLDLPPFCEADRRADLVKHALGSGGSVTLEIERHNDEGPAQRYTIKRIHGQAPRVVDSVGRPVEIAPRDTFGPDREPIILLQREIDQVSGLPEYRRALLDRLIGDEVSAAEADVDEYVRRLRTNGAELRKHTLEQAKRPELDAQIGKLDHELQLFEDNGVLAKLAVHDQMQAVERSLTSAAELTTGTSDLDDDWRLALHDLQDHITDRGADLNTRNDEIAASAAEALATVASAIAQAEKLILAALNQAGQTIGGMITAHDERVLPLADELNRIKQELHADKLDADRPLKLSDARGGYRDQLNALDRKAAAGTKLTKLRLGLLDDVAKARACASQIRADAAARINNLLAGRIQVVVVAQGDRHGFTEDVRRLLNGSGTNSTTIEAITTTDGIDGSTLAAVVAEGVAAVMSKFSITSAQATKIVNWLTHTDADRLSELEVLAPRDRVDIRLNVDGENKTLDRLSAGQRATAILLLIFAIDGKCMILDQPEDDLDNRFIFDDVVRMIREQKATPKGGTDRQIIAATHNPNIPALGDAELVVVLDAGNDKVTVQAQGSIDAGDIRVHIRQVLEGGEEAFLRRYRKYGGGRADMPSTTA